LWKEKKVRSLETGEKGPHQGKKDGSVKKRKISAGGEGKNSQLLPRTPRMKFYEQRSGNKKFITTLAKG